MFQTAVKGTAPSSPQSSQNASATRPQASTLVPVMNEKCKTCGSIVYFPTLHNCDSATLPSRPSSGASKSSASLSKAAPETVTLSDPSTRAQPASLASTNKAGSTATTSTRTPSVLDEAAARPTSVPSFSLNSANQGSGLCVNLAVNARPAGSNNTTSEPSDDRKPAGIFLGRLAIPDIRVAQSQAINFGSDTLNIKVGQGTKQQTFTVYRKLITPKSAYFADLTTEQPETTTFELPMDEPHIFALYFHLLWTGRIPTRATIAFDLDLEEYTSLCKLYLLCHRLRDKKAKNDTLDAIQAKFEHGYLGPLCLPSSSDVNLVYAISPEASGARKLMIDLYSCKATGAWMKMAVVPFSPQFLSDLVVIMIDRSGVKQAPGMAGEYHEK